MYIILFINRLMQVWNSSQRTAFLSEGKYRPNDIQNEHTSWFGECTVQTLVPTLWLDEMCRKHNIHNLRILWMGNVQVINIHKRWVFWLRKSAGEVNIHNGACFSNRINIFRPLEIHDTSTKLESYEMSRSSFHSAE